MLKGLTLNCSLFVICEFPQFTVVDIYPINYISLKNFNGVNFTLNKQLLGRYKIVTFHKHTHMHVISSSPLI